MRIVVFSDSHHNVEPLRNIVTANDDAELYIYLGDGERDILELEKEFPYKTFLHVRGNCDWGADTPAEAMTEVHGKKIFYAHGQFYNVKSGPKRFFERAKEKGADIALFGHTHQPFLTYEDGIHIMNPGSVSVPRDGGAPSYGLIDLTPEGIATQIVRMEPKK